MSLMKEVVLVHSRTHELKVNAIIAEQVSRVFLSIVGETPKTQLIDPCVMSVIKAKGVTCCDSSRKAWENARYPVVKAWDVALGHTVVLKDHQAGALDLLVVLYIDCNLIVVEVHDLSHMPQPDLFQQLCIPAQ